MIPYDEINIGDVFASPIDESSITYTVTRKVAGWIELEPSIKHPMLPIRIVKTVGDLVFNKRVIEENV